MSNAGARAKTTPKKRGQGRPVSGENDVGRERLLAAAEKLLRALPPARVTIARIAKEANADPALVRYYFGNRTALLVAVVERVTSHTARLVEADEAPAAALADHIGKGVQMMRSAPFMHRLMIDELAEVSTEDSRTGIRQMHLDLVDFYRQVMRADGGRELAPVDPLFLHLVVLGASDFFSSAEPLIRDLLPKDADMEKLADGFQAFLVKLVLDGLRKR